jgi:hypothetical protein
VTVRRLLSASALPVLALSAAACGGSKHAAAPPPATSTTSAPPATTSTSSGNGPGALQAEANAAATGDIPDNQVFLLFRNARAGYSLKYPEGWARQGAGNAVVFRDKNNIVRIVVGSGSAPTAGSVIQDVRRLHGLRVVKSPQPIKLPAGRAFKVVYSISSAPNAVTGKRVALMVDRYYVAKAGRRAVVDLGTPQGVDNVDAYRLMIQSFRWR